MENRNKARTHRYPAEVILSVKYVNEYVKHVEYADKYPKLLFVEFVNDNE